MDNIDKEEVMVRVGGDIRNFVVRVSRGRGRVINKNCWWDAKELANYIINYL